MEFKNITRNEYWRCDSPENTIKRIIDSLKKININIEKLINFKASQYIYWCSIISPEISLSANGKGITQELSDASAYAEFIERFSFPIQWFGRFNMNEPNASTEKFINYQWLDGYVNSHQDNLKSPHINIEDLIELQDNNKNIYNIKEIKDHDVSKHWVDGYSIINNTKIKVPIKLIDWLSQSNGLASGNTIEEAVIHAACELFERHCALKMIKNEIKVPSYNLDSINSPLIKKIIDFYNSLHISIEIKDLSFDKEFPCIGIIFFDENLPDNHMEHNLVFFGSSFNLEIALTRCFTEVFQGRMINKELNSIIPRFRFNKKNYKIVNDYGDLLQFGVPQKDLSFLKSSDTKQFINIIKKDIFAEIDQIKKICKSLKTDCIIVNITHPIIQFPVVRAIIPNLLTGVSASTEERIKNNRKIKHSFFSN